jgi:hypothetical protein
MPIRLSLFFLMVCCAALPQSSKYSGPRPPKADVPYLLHAASLLETEVAEAQEEKRKGGNVYYVAGAGSPAKTPLAEPIFLIRTEKLQADRLELYRMEVRNGRRETVFPERRRNNPRSFPLTVKKVAEDLYRVETGAMLDNGQYSLTPSGSNAVFLFEVY